MHALIWAFGFLGAVALVFGFIYFSLVVLPLIGRTAKYQPRHMLIQQRVWTRRRK